MDYIYDLFMNFLKHQYLGGMKVEFQRRYLNFAGFIKSILIFVSKKIKSPMLLKWYEGE